MTVSKSVLLGALPQWQDKWVMIDPDQRVRDVVQEELEAHDRYAAMYDKIAPYFDDPSIEQICKDLYDFCIDNLEYCEESEDFQSTSVPQGLLNRGFCDCKGYSNFIGGVLDALNRMGRKIKWCYRFASYKLADPDPHHVYIIVWDGDQEIWVDPTPGSSKETPIWLTDKKISGMALMSNIAGFGNETTFPIQPAAHEESSVFIPPDKDIVWIDGSWKIVNGNGIGAAKVGDLLDTGLAVITSLSSLFGGGPKSKAAQKIFAMFPLPPNPTAPQVQQVIDAINAHYQTDSQGNLDSEWRAAYADILNQYGRIHEYLVQGQAPPAVVVPPIGSGSNVSYPVPTPGVSPYGTGGMSTGNMLLWGGLALGVIFILPKLMGKRK